MTLSHSDVVSAFERGHTKGSSSSMFIDGDVLYSYGHHFPLLVRMKHWRNGKPYLMNADRYSVTTSQHQSKASSIAGALIPFSALEEALASEKLQRPDIPSLRNEIELLDKSRERQDETGYYRYWHSETGKNERISAKRYLELDKDERIKCHKIMERRPEAVLLRFRDRYYLSSMDGWNYFISELPEPVETVEQAFESLIPFEARDKGYKRQGEWFFVKASKVNEAVDLKGVKPFKWRVLDSKIQQTGHHKVRDYHLHFGFPGPLVRGTVRHTDGDHGVLKLGEEWYVAIESRHKGSWGASGRVD